MNFLRHLGFMAIGIATFYLPNDPFNVVVIVLGCLIGLIYSILCKGFMHRALRLLNGAVKKEHGKKAIKKATEVGGLFIIPFAVLTLVSTVFFGWQLQMSFISTGIMAIGTAIGLEFSKLTKKPKLKNTIILTLLAFGFSTLWIMGMPYLAKAPEMVEGGIALAKTLIGNM